MKSKFDRYEPEGESIELSFEDSERYAAMAKECEVDLSTDRLARRLRAWDPLSRKELGASEYEAIARRIVTRCWDHKSRGACREIISSEFLLAKMGPLDVEEFSLFCEIAFAAIHEPWRYIKTKSIVDFLEQRLVDLLLRPGMWGPPIAVELQVISAVELIHLAEGKSDEFVRETTGRFIGFVNKFHGSSSVLSLADRLGLAAKWPDAASGLFIETLRAFIKQELRR